MGRSACFEEVFVDFLAEGFFKRAVVELLVFMGIVAPHFQLKNFMHDPMPFGWGGVFAALPFAIWFYLAIEGVAMVAEETKDPQHTIPKGYILGISTLVLLALGVMIFTGGGSAGFSRH